MSTRPTPDRTSRNSRPVIFGAAGGLVVLAIVFAALGSIGVAIAMLALAAIIAFFFTRN